MQRRSFTWRSSAILPVVLGVALVTLATSPADAHFVLDEPPSWMSEDSLGLPEKLGPCGDELDGTDAATPTGTVTTVQEGQTITVTIHEVIFHPGHYRIALAQDRSELPIEPAVTVGTTPCGSAAIQSPPVFPVLADGVFVHTTPFTTPQSINITLPEGVTCTKCTLQVIEFMAEHALNNPGGCFYHHCADLAIASPAADSGPGKADASLPRQGGAGTDASLPRKDAATPVHAVDAAAHGGEAAAPRDAGVAIAATPSASGACGCRVSGERSPGAGLSVGAGAFLFLCRKRRRANAQRWV